MTVSKIAVLVAIVLFVAVEAASTTSVKVTPNEHRAQIKELLATSHHLASTYTGPAVTKAVRNFQEHVDRSLALPAVKAHMDVRMHDDLSHHISANLRRRDQLSALFEAHKHRREAQKAKAAAKQAKANAEGKGKELALPKRKLLNIVPADDQGVQPAYTSICPDDDFANFEALVFIQEAILLVVQLAAAILDVVCDLEIHVGGFGGNPASLACIATDAALAAVETVVESLNFCDSSRGFQETFALYEHLGHMHHNEITVLMRQTECHPVPQLSRGTGCNGADDDCDDHRDECNEDGFPPTITLAPGCGDRWYTSPAVAQTCLEEHLTIEDDCHSVVQSIAFAYVPCGLVATITATDSCQNTATLVVNLKYDVTPPVVTISTAINIISGGSGMYDVGLTYAATDSCGQPLKVRVAVYSDEIVPNFADAVLYTKTDGSFGALLHHAPGSSCSAANAVCVAGTTYDGRVYQIIVSATDVAGNSASATALVQDRQSPNAVAVNGGPLFLLTETIVTRP
jgi:hypothetical protein